MTTINPQHKATVLSFVASEGIEPSRSKDKYLSSPISKYSVSASTFPPTCNLVTRVGFAPTRSDIRVSSLSLYTTPCVYIPPPRIIIPDHFRFGEGLKLKQNCLPLFILLISFVFGH